HVCRRRYRQSGDGACGRGLVPGTRKATVDAAGRSLWPRVDGAVYHDGRCGMGRVEKLGPGRRAWCVVGLGGAARAQYALEPALLRSEEPVSGAARHFRALDRAGDYDPPVLAPDVVERGPDGSVSA